MLQNILDSSLVLQQAPHACGGTFISSNAASYVVRKEDDHSSPLAANVTEAQRVKSFNKVLSMWMWTIAAKPDLVFSG